MKRLSILGAVAALAFAPAAFADDRPVTLEERAEIEAALQAEGFVSWGEIEFDIDDNYFEVDDAIHEDGAEYDLKLDVNFQIIDRDRD